MACSMTSISRISPIRITSGAWRRVFFSARFPRIGVDADLALRDQAVLVRVHVLDRVLDGDDVAVGVLVAVADHRRERGGLARARAADEEHQAALGHDHVLQHRRQLQVVEARDRGGDHAQHHADLALLDEALTRKRPMPAGADGEVALLLRLELAPPACRS